MALHSFVKQAAQTKFGPLLCFLAIVFSGFFVYFNSLKCPFIWDDQDLIIKNTFIREYKSIPKIFTTDLSYGSGKQSGFYRPIQNISYMIDYYVGRFNPVIYHLHNIILHILVALLVFYILSLYAGKPCAFFTSLLFVIHPMHVEAVTYVSGRADLLVSFFMLFSLFCYVKFKQQGFLRFYVYSLLGFLFALLSKELALVFPLAIIIFEKSFLRSNFKGIFGFILVEIFYILLRFSMLGVKSFEAASNIYPFKYRLLFFFKSIILYIKKLIMPANLTMSYTVNLPKTFFDFWVLAGVILLVAVLCFSPYFYKKKRIIFFGICWFFIFLLPQSNIFAINAFFADHFIYFSSIGFFVIVSYILVNFFENRQNEIN